MRQNTIYTAVGNLQHRITENGEKYPVIRLKNQDYPVDPQELTVWAALCWRLCGLEQLQTHYAQLARSLPVERRTLESCVTRLEMRGLIAKGVGSTGLEALYDLLCDLYVQPVSEKLSYRVSAFLSLLRHGVSVTKARRVFVRDRRNDREAQVMALARQALLSTAELVKCAELGVTDVSSDEKLMDALYDDEDTTSDNIGMLMQVAQSREPVTAAIANLYLRKQIVLERV